MSLPGARIRDNAIFGTTTDNPLTAGALTFNSTGLIGLSIVSGDHAIVTLDPLKQYGEPEIVGITAHGAAATVATITRGLYGTTPRSHPQGTTWVHAPVEEDYVEIVTSGTRPSNPYKGQMVFETDTNCYVGRDTSNAWQTAISLGAWIAWVPALTGSVSNPVLGTGGIAEGKYVRFGRMIQGWGKIQFGTAAASFGSGTYQVSMPVAPATQSAGQSVVSGSGYILDAGTTHYLMALSIQQSTFGNQFVLRVDTNANLVQPTVPMTWAINDALFFTFNYEALA